jgi:hypothetical protein
MHESILMATCRSNLHVVGAPRNLALVHAMRVGSATSAPFESSGRRVLRARCESWHGAASSAPSFDPIQALGGLGFLTIMGLSAYGEWRLAMWLVSLFTVG